ncbi:MAG: hypothetical protein JXD19_06980 [Deltaproteobacteria bacterium]|nr:hypothetical protein [Deltaproteobacteria bacterium]
MSNELYLIFSYFLIGAACFVVAVIVYLVLRKGFTNVVSLLPTTHLSAILRKLFFLGIVVPALFGFCSVSFKSCSVTTYERVIENRSYLVEKNQEQLASSLRHTVYAVMVWGGIVFGALVIITRENGEKG